MTDQTLSDEMLSVIWAPLKHDPEWKLAYLLELQTRCKSSGNKIGEWLSGQLALRAFSVKEMRALEIQLESSTLQNTLRDVTLRAKQFFPTLPIARLAIDINRPPNPINPELYIAEHLAASRYLVTSLEVAIRRDIEEFSPQARVGLLMLSAAYYGDLLDIPQLSALIKLDPDKVGWISGIPEVRLHLSIRGQKDAELRQWFPDPTTMALLSRCGSDLAELRSELGNHATKIKFIRELLAAVGMPEELQPRTLGQLLKLLRIQVQSHQPQLLVSYATRSSYVTHPLIVGSWCTMHGHSTPLDVEARGSKNKNSQPEDNEDEDDKGLDWINELCRKVRTQQLQPVENVLPPNDLKGLVSCWAARLLCGRSYYGTPLKPSTVANYIRAVGRGLVDCLSTESILEVSPDTLEALYEHMLESQPTPSTQRNLAKGLLEFHGFLQKEFSYPPISPYAALGIGKTPQFVDAQIINEDQYRQVLRDLAGGPLAQRSPRLATVAQVMVIFGFRLGLRRNEALKLLRRDLQLPEISAGHAADIRRRHSNLKLLSAEQIKTLELEVCLHIRPHYQRSLKTRNSTRTLPLHVLLEPDELDLIESFARQRAQEEAIRPCSEYLFCIPELKSQWVSESSLLPAIHSAMCRVTSCAGMHYHHLRHSFATWLTFKLAASAWGVSGNVGLLFGNHPQTAAWLRDSGRLERAFFHSKGAATRKIVHITSALLGHASPKISLLHYVHCMSWLAALYWQWNPAHWPPGHVIAKIAQVSLPTKLEDDSATELPAEILHIQRIIGRIRVYKNPLPIAKKRGRPKKWEEIDTSVIDRMSSIAGMLSYEVYAEATGQPINRDWFEFSESDRLAMLDRAKYIHSLGTHRLTGPETGDIHEAIKLIPRPPKHGGVAGLAGYADSLYRLLRNPNNQKVNRVVDDFVERCWSSETTLRFSHGREEQSAREYVWLLMELGIPQRDIEFIIYDQNSAKQTTSFWRKALKLPRMRISEHVTENSQAKNTRIGIRVKLRIQSATEEAETSNHHSGAALRFLFLMASIDWHDR